MFSENLKLLIKMKDIHQKDLAAFLAVKPNTVSDWINQGNSPKIEHLCRISEYFNVSLDWLIADKGEMHRGEYGTYLQLNDFNRLNDKEKALVLERIRSFLDLKDTPKRPVKHNEPKKPSVAKEVALISVHEPQEDAEAIGIRVYDQSASAGLGNYLHDEPTYDMLSVDAVVLPSKAGMGIRIRGDSMEPSIPDGCIVWVQGQAHLDNGQIGIFILNDEALCKKLHKDYKRKVTQLVSINPKYPPILITASDVLRTVGLVVGEPYAF